MSPSMVSTKQYSLLQIFFLFNLLYMSYTLQCKTCEKNDRTCLLGDDIETRDCASDNELCYSWFDRTKSEIGVQRGCISPDMDEYKMIKNLIGNEQSKCIKRINGLDCFKFCSEDKCN